MKKIYPIILMLLVLTFLFSVPVYASEGSEPGPAGAVVDIEYLENGDYIVTVIEDGEIIIPSDATATTVTKTKTSNYYNSSGTRLWNVKVQGTFTYNGTTSTCTKASHQATSYASTWEIISASHSKSGNHATATATARHHLYPGYNDYTRSVTLTCSPTGVFS